MGPQIPLDAVRVTIQKGWATLTGQISWQFRKTSPDSVRKLPGVTGVINDISLKPAVTTSDIKRKIEDALARRAQLEAGAIRVDVLDGNRVKLQGKVDHGRELRLTALER